MPDIDAHDEYQGVGGSYVLDPDTGKRRPNVPDTPAAAAADGAAAGDTSTPGAPAPASADADDKDKRNTKLRR